MSNEPNAGTEKVELNSLFPALRNLSHTPGTRPPLPGIRGWAAFRGLTLLLPIVLIFLIFSVGLAVTVNQEQSRQKTLPIASGKITRVERENVFHGAGANIVHYTFQANAQQWQGIAVEEAVGNNARTLSAARVGDSVQIQYDKSNPGRSSIHEDSPSEFPVILVVVFFPLMALVFFGMIFGPLFLPGFKAYWNTSQLYKWGLLSNGTVVFVKPLKWMQANVTLGGEVIFTFKDEAEITRQGAMHVENMWLLNQFTPGTEVVVAYDPRNAKKSVILEPYVA